MIGETIAYYRILAELGRGGMGVVYKAHDTKLNRPAALKVLKPELLEDEEHRQRFLREARSAASVTHPYIASIYDAGEADGTLFIAMEYVEGMTLRALLAKGALPIPEAQQYATEIAEGLAKAHQAGLVHRDMKPDNVMIATDGHAKILDFGLAKVVEKRDEAATVTLGKAERAEVTTQGAILGTAAYMSPEQARGEPVDSRSDIFSFGSTVYEMVTGNAPFQRSTHTDTLASILRDEPLSPHDSNPAISGELNRIISRCLHKKPEDRYNDTRDLVAALKDLQAVTATPTGLEPAPLQPSRRWGRILAGIAALVAIVALVVVQPWKPAPNPNEQNGASSAETPVRPNWILVAEFEGPPDSPLLAVAARELVVANLEQSQILTPLTWPQMRRGLELALKPDTTQIIGDTARELAIRASARVYVEGRVDRVLRGFSIVLRALDADSGESVASVNTIAENEEVFIFKLDTLGRELRQKLGEKSDAVRATKNLVEVITPSLKAYQLYVEAKAISHERGSSDAIPLLHSAIGEDPDFALAWGYLAPWLWNQGHRDSARAALEEALRRPHRLTANQLLFAQANYAFMMHYNLEESLRLRKLLVSRGVNDYNNLGVMLDGLGRFEEAERAYARHAEMQPFGPGLVELNNRTRQLVNLGRYEDAIQVAAQLPQPQQETRSMSISMARCQWDEAESLATLRRNDPDAPEWLRTASALCLASVYAARGQIRACDATLDSLQETATSGQAFCNLLLSRLFLQLVAGQPDSFTAPTAGGDTTTAGLVLQGVTAAVHGDLTRAVAMRRALDATSEFDRRSYKTDAAFLDAWIAAAQGRWTDTIHTIGRLTTSGQIPQVADRLPMRWLLGQAHEELGQLEEAAEAFGLVLDPTRIPDRSLGPEVFRFGIPYSFAHYRLVLLYSKMGRVEDARRHWEIFEKTFTNPDPELVPMIEEARQALAEAEAKAKIKS